MCVAREICVLPGRYMCGAKDIYVHKCFKFLFHKNDNIMVPLVLHSSVSCYIFNPFALKNDYN